MEEDGQLSDLFVNYFSNLFSTSNPTGIDTILEEVTPRVTEEMNLALTRNFTVEEVHSAMQQMAPLSTPGPDGMSPVFYKSFWHIVGKDVTKAALAILNEGIIPASINSTFISLIPKVKNPKKVFEFRPISLCNVFYKIIAKVLVNMLKSVLPHVVSESQSAFLSGRLIIDNVLVAFETLHYLKRKTQGKTSYMALKLDTSKAYDRVEWSFLEKIVLHLGFSVNFVAIIMSFIKSVSYVVLFNGEPMGHINPTWGASLGRPFVSLHVLIVCYWPSRATP